LDSSKYKKSDALTTDLEKEQEAARSTFDKYLTAARLILTRAPQYIIPFWYGKEAMFWLPYGWFPYWAEWIISFPRAPLGSVSIASWQLACTGMVTLVGELVSGVTGLIGAAAPQTGKQAQKKKEEPLKAHQEKKEL
jgi:tail-anchored protein insertion receptor